MFAEELRRLYKLLLPLVWIFLSSLLTIYNKYLFSYMNINVPIFLTLMHLSCMCIVAFGIKTCSTSYVEKGTFSNRSSSMYLLAMSICQGSSIVLRNRAYKYMSVSALQVLTAFSPAWVYYLSIVVGFETFRTENFIYILGITTGTVFASLANFHAEFTGCSLQGAGILLEGIRTIILKLFLQNNPQHSIADIILRTSLFSVMLLVFPAYAVEGEKISHLLEGQFSGLPQKILGNAAVAVFLNLVSIDIVRQYPAILASVTAVSKDFILVFFSPFLFGTRIESAHAWYILSALSTCLYVVQKDAS